MHLVKVASDPHLQKAGCRFEQCAVCCVLVMHACWSRRGGSHVVGLTGC